MSHACSPLSAGRDSLAVGLPKFESERLSIAGRTLTKRSMRVPTVEQQGLRTSTEPSFRSSYIRGISGRSLRRRTPV